MNLHEIAALSSTELSTHFRQALAQQNVALVLDLFTQVESRFQNYTTSKEGSQQFVDEFLALCGSAEIRALHNDNRLQRCVTRFEYLMELAGERARMQSSEETLQQIVESRERGSDMIQVLGRAPVQGMIASELAEKLGISPANLSPLIRLFNIHRIIDKKQMGKNAFLRLTTQGQALLELSNAADMAKKQRDYKSTADQLDETPTYEDDRHKILQQAIGEVIRDILGTPFRSKRAILGAAKHGLRRIEDQYRLSNPLAADILRTLGEEINHSMGIVSEAAREVISELRETPDSSKQSPAEIIQTKLTEKEELHRNTAPLAALVFRLVSEGFNQPAM